MNIMDKICEIRSCIEILGSDIKTHTIVLQLRKSYKV